ncbi:DUF4349 domain-containing protein [Streptomyces sp. NPDC007369]|uniref:DUF4349 domain-containing protein n=1 Tax=Streptomyces sp. NPDC007369 TaxID=3154589 RepID=UPI00340BDD06
MQTRNNPPGPDSHDSPDGPDGPDSPDGPRTGGRSRTGRGTAALAGLGLACALALTGCGAGSDGAGASSAEKAAVAPQAPAPGGKAGAGAAAPAPAEGAAGSPKAAAAVRPQVIRTANLGIEAQDAAKVLAAARTAAEGAGGYVGNESTQRGEDGRVRSALTLRVPADRFDSVIGALEGSGKLLHRKVEAQDVTEKVADVDSRVKSQQASVARVREMMERATALGDVVMLEGELGKRQSDLESLLAQQNALRDQTSMGTVTVEVSEPADAPAKEKEDAPPSVLGALAGGWKAFTTVLRYVVLAVAVVLPFAVTAALAALAFRLYRRLRPPKPRTGLPPRTVRTAPAPAPAPAPVPAPRPAAPEPHSAPGPDLDPDLGPDPTESPRVPD